MSFDSELEAFKSYAAAFPEKCVFLVDTYDTINGIKNAIEVGKILREKGKEMLGVRIDSGDLAYFSNIAREMLDEAGFPDAQVVASNDLDEHIITSLKTQEASVSVWGVGTKLVTAYDQPALGAVYKLAAIKDIHGNWEPKVKVSQQSIKINIPGDHQVSRFIKNGKAVADMIYLSRDSKNTQSYIIIDPIDPTKRKRIQVEDLEEIKLLKPIFKEGLQVYDCPSIEAIKSNTEKNLQNFDKAHKRLTNPHVYPVGLEENLYQLRTDLVFKMKNYDK
jgi:nicotinate phosphoribosyltransferase